MRLLLLINVVFASYVGGSADVSYFRRNIVVRFNHISLRLFQNAAADFSGNIAVSGYCDSILLSIVTQGAKLNTEDQLRSLLVLDRNDSNNEVALQILIDEINSLKNVNVSFAYEVFHSTSFIPYPQFRDKIKNILRAETQSIDTSNLIEARGKIDQWSMAQTNNHVGDIAPDVIRNEPLILVSAVFFKGMWEKPFEPELGKGIFHGENDRIVETQYMSQLSFYKHGELTNLKSKFIGIPYKINGKEDEVSMFIILPNDRNSYSHLEKNILSINMDELLNGDLTEMKLTMPKFNITSKSEHRDILRYNGLYDVFSDAADFTGIIQEPRLKVDNVIQKVVLEVNEESDYPYPSTGPILSEYGVPQEFKVDRSFICIVATTGENPFILLIARYIE